MQVTPAPRLSAPRPDPRPLQLPEIRRRVAEYGLHPDHLLAAHGSGNSSIQD
jgi:hypothetical protein